MLATVLVIILLIFIDLYILKNHDAYIPVSWRQREVDEMPQWLEGLKNFVSWCEQVEDRVESEEETSFYLLYPTLKGAWSDYLLASEDVRDNYDSNKETSSS